MTPKAEGPGQQLGTDRAALTFIATIICKLSDRLGRDF